MRKNLLDIMQKAKNLTLTAEEKSAIRADLALLMEKRPVRNAAPVRQLLQQRSLISAVLEKLRLKSLINNLSPMTIILIIALLVGGGTSAAAASALPGDVLYPVKVYVNEEVGGWLAVSAEEQANWDAHLAGKRLEEAEHLAAAGRLNAGVRADIDLRFKKHAADFKKLSDKIATGQNTGVALEINSDLESSLRAHERVMTQIAADNADKEDDGSELQPILSAVRAQLGQVIQARADAEDEVTVQTDDQFKTAAVGKLKAAEHKIAEVRDFIAKKAPVVSAETKIKAEAKLKMAEKALARGQAEVSRANYGQAFASFQEALRIAQEAKLSLATSDKINIEVKLPDIRVNLGEGFLEDADDDTAVDDSRAKAEKEVNEESGEDSGKADSPSDDSSKSESEAKMVPGNKKVEIKGDHEVEIDFGI